MGPWATTHNNCHEQKSPAAKRSSLDCVLEDVYMLTLKFL